MTRFVLVRHGETEWNREVRFRGQSDVPLNAAGLAQAQAAGRRIAAQWQPAAIYHGPLSRARQTAEAIGAAVGVAAQPHLGLLDINFGQLQGLTPAEARERYPEAVDAWFAAPGRTHFPAGERLADVSARAMPAIREIAARHEGETVVVVGHQVLNRVILLGVLGLGWDRLWRIGQDTCAINVFDLAAGEFTLLSLNDVCHLQ